MFRDEGKRLNQREYRDDEVVFSEDEVLDDLHDGGGVSSFEQVEQEAVVDLGNDFGNDQIDGLSNQRPRAVLGNDAEILIGVENVSEGFAIPRHYDDSLSHHFLQPEMLDEVLQLVVPKILLGVADQRVGPLLVELGDEQKEPVILADFLALEGAHREEVSLDF